MVQGLIGIDEASRQIGICRATIKDWAERGILTIKKVGRSLYVDGESIKNAQDEILKLSRQMRGVEQLRMELEATAQACMDDIKEYKLEMMLRKDSAQRVNLYMEIFASLADLIYEGRYDEREYKTVVMFLKGHGIKDIAEELGMSTATVVNNIRKCNEILFNLQPYTKTLEISRECDRKARLAEKNAQILRTMLEVCREEGGFSLGHLREDDVAIWMTPVDCLNLSVKTKKTLANGRVKYVGDIVYYGEDRLMNINGFGPTSLQEVKGLMAQLNQPMGTRMPAWDYIKKAYGKQEPFVYEKLFELDAETNDYLDTVLEGLPEDRVMEIRELFLGLFAMGEKYKENFGKYKQLNVALREDIARMEKALKNEDYYLSPAYEEVKRLFAKVESYKSGREPNEEVDAASEKPAEAALGLMDCIFSQEAYQAESKRMKENRQIMADLEKKVKKLESQLSEKTYLAQVKAEKAEKAKEKQAVLSKAANEVYVEKVRMLKQELEKVQKERDALAKGGAEALETERMKALKSECTVLKRKLTRQEQEIKKLQSDKESLDQTIESLNQSQPATAKMVLEEMELRQKAESEVRDLKLELLECRKNLARLATGDVATPADRLRIESYGSQRSIDLQIENIKLSNEVFELWNALVMYELQVEFFNNSFFFEKMWKKLKKYSDRETKTVTIKF